MHSSARQSVPLLRTDPLLEPDRFFPAPSSHLHGVSDAQNAALTRLLQRCDQARPHLDTVAALSAWIERHEDPARVRRRISVVLALEQPDRERVYGLLMPGELEAFRRIARLKLPACVWVFS